MHKRLIIATGIVVLLSGCRGGASTPKVTPESTTILHRSYFLDAKFYDKAYKTAPDVVRGTIIGGIVPHHLLAANNLAAYYAGVAAVTQPEVVVVLGPNHPDLGVDPIVISGADWKTPYGTLFGNQKITKQLVEEGSAVVNENLFATEHSISAEVAFIKKSFPKATVIPIILKSSVRQAYLDRLAESLNTLLPSTSLVLASVDFTHYTTPHVANANDKKSIPVLAALDLEHLDSVVADSHPSLSVLMRYLLKRGVTKGELVENLNSADIINDQTLTSVTSYIFMTFAKERIL